MPLPFNNLDMRPAATGTGTASATDALWHRDEVLYVFSRKAHWPTEIARALVNLADAVTTRDDSLDAVKVDGYRTLRK